MNILVFLVSTLVAVPTFAAGVDRSSGADGVTTAEAMYGHLESAPFDVDQRENGRNVIEVLELICLKSRKSFFRCEGTDARTGIRKVVDKGPAFGHLLMDTMVTMYDSTDRTIGRAEIRLNRLYCEEHLTGKFRCSINLNLD